VPDSPFHIADLFCGAGGTSAGAVEAVRALGRSPSLTAINHWPVAVQTHAINHPDARHLCTGIDAVNPTHLYQDGQLDLLWASPECTHHSIARGGKPIHDQSRATAWCVVRWAEALRPPVILIENVPEFQNWGPLGANNRPLASRKGHTFRAWKNALISLGYKVDARLLCAADYGDPTTRTRLFIQAVRGRRKIVWPHPTHSQNGDLLTPHRWTPARQIIDWSLPATSIFERKKPLSPKTLARIQAGLQKFGLQSFIVPQYSERQGQSPRSHDLEAPCPTVTSHGAGALVQPYVVSWDHTSGGPLAGVSSIEAPLSTIVTKARHGIAEPFLVEMRGTSPRQVQNSARSLNEPCSAVTTSGAHHALIQPCLLGQQSGAALRPVNQPAPTVSTAGAIALIDPFLIKYYGTAGPQSVDAPLATVTTKDRMALALPIVEIQGTRYLLDIRFRMLQPHELALAQGFPPSYRFAGTKTEQVRQIGNAVPRHLARALVAAVVSQNPEAPTHLFSFP
jgi:DNA (cytosine-5)-methyltransferase 1